MFFLIHEPLSKIILCPKKMFCLMSFPIDQEQTVFHWSLILKYSVLQILVLKTTIFTLIGGTVSRKYLDNYAPTRFAAVHG